MLHQPIPHLFQRTTNTWIKLVFAVLISVSMMMIDARFDVLSHLRLVIASTLYPVQKGLIFFPKTWKNVSQYGVNQMDLVQKNQELQQQLAQEMLKMHQFSQLSEENIKLKKILDLKNQSGFELQIAELLYATPDPFQQKMMLDRGSKHGVQSGQAVINEQGLLGQITEVYPLHAQVSLITQRDQAVPVQVARTFARSMVSGTGDREFLELRFMSASSDVQVDDLLVTSGLDGLYPAGIPVASIKKIQHAGENGFLKILAKPTASKSADRYVMIVSLKNKNLRLNMNTPSLPLQQH